MKLTLRLFGGSRVALGATWVLLGMMTFGCAAAYASAPHAFDAKLSLTGACNVTSVDPVADPSCPQETPSGRFSNPSAVAVDSDGDIFVASQGGLATSGRIDIFNAAGKFLYELKDPLGPVGLAVDSAGVLYVINLEGEGSEEKIVRYEPEPYEPASGKIEYPNAPIAVVKKQFGVLGIAVNPANDHLLVNTSHRVAEYKSAAEGNGSLADIIAEGTIANASGSGLAIDSAHNRLYVTDKGKSPEPERTLVRAFELGGSHTLLFTVDGSTTPNAKFLDPNLTLAADEGTGDFFVYDSEAQKVYEFGPTGAYVETIEHSFKPGEAPQIAVDNGANSPNGALNSEGRYLYVPTYPAGEGHSFAFGPLFEQPPAVEGISFAEVTESEAELHATINPGGLPTTYRFEYTTAAEGFDGATLAGEGQIKAGELGVPVSVGISSLSPGTAYRFRVVATNGMGSDEAEDAFATYPAQLLEPTPCPNLSLRMGPSALLPDCRAYELVTPPDTNARSPRGQEHKGDHFKTRESSPVGDRLSFQVEGGGLPGIGGTGAYGGDPYLSTRGAEGWTTATAGPTPLESPALIPGSPSPDQGYSFWNTGGPEGTASVNEDETRYVRYPDGHSALIGRGSLTSDPRAYGKMISENGTHIVFISGFAGSPAIQLEPEAPPSGTRGIYDRTSDEVTHVVSILPGEVPLKAGEEPVYTGASLDGRGIAFEVAGTLYLRYEDQITYKVAEGAAFAGVAEGGRRVFYVKGGNLFAFEVGTKAVIPFSASGNAIPVNVASGGTAAYFVSPSVLTKETNPVGAKAKAGKDNLYLSREGAISFVGIVTEKDVVEERDAANNPVWGLGLWTRMVGDGGLAADPSRATPDGTVLLFESRAPLTGHDSNEQREVYRYDNTGSLQCLSCNPTGAPAASEASLESLTVSGDRFGFFPVDVIGNLRSDGRRAFFQSSEALVPGDTDGLQDVYEWEEQGVGSCQRPGGCVFLVSSGHSLHPDYLYAVSDSGGDVFFRTGDLLVPADSDETPSIYDARVGGGFPEGLQEPCQGEGCRPALAAPPALATPGSDPDQGKANKVCRKGQRRVKRHGKARCVSKHRKRVHRHHRRAGSQRKGGRG